MKTFTISELAREFQVTPRALRFYEDKGLLSPTRDGLNRVYSTRDRARLKLILQGKSVGFSLQDIREILDLYTLEGHRAQLKLSLKKSRDQIKNLEKQREDIVKANVGLQKPLVGMGVTFNEVDPAPFRPALKSSGFCKQAQDQFGTGAWGLLTKVTGP